MSALPVAAPSAPEREAVERALGCEVAELEAVPVRAVPGKRSAFRVDVTAANGRKRRVLAKVYAKDQGARAFEVLGDLRRRGFGEGPWRVPEPLGYDAETRLLLLEWVEGTRLRDIIAGGLPAESAVERAALWLAALHRCGTPAGRVYSFERHLHTMRGWGERIAAACPEARPAVCAVLCRIEAEGRRLSGWKPGPAHRDFSPDHVLFAGAAAAGIDFDEFCQYDPLFDVAHFAAHLGLLAPGRAEPLARRFTAAYRANAPGFCEARLALYTKISNYKLAHITGTITRPPDWDRRLRALLEK